MPVVASPVPPPTMPPIAPPTAGSDSRPVSPEGKAPRLVMPLPSPSAQGSGPQTVSGRVSWQARRIPWRPATAPRSLCIEGHAQRRASPARSPTAHRTSPASGAGWRQRQHPSLASRRRASRIIERATERIRSGARASSTRRRRGAPARSRGILVPRGQCPELLVDEVAELLELVISARPWTPTGLGSRARALSICPFRQRTALTGCAPRRWRGTLQRPPSYCVSASSWLTFPARLRLRPVTH